MSSIVNKIKEAVHGDHSKTSSAPEGTHGPHNSRVANAADPRVDSDRDGSHNIGAPRRAGHGEYGSGNPLTGSGAAEGTYGPHSSRMANAADPRVDSDRDGSSKLGQGMTGGRTGGAGIGSGMTSGGMTSGITGTHGTSEGNYGPHSSRLANAADPRVDSDRDGSSKLGQGMTGGRTTGAGAGGILGSHGTTTTATGTHGPHNSRMANAMDPRVDSDRDGSNTLGSRGPGPAPNTAGPHQSDMMNKLDPRVDSDRDGSNTLGPNKTYQ